MIVWYSHRKNQYEDFRVFVCQSEDRFMFILMKANHPLHIMVFGVVTRDDDVMTSFLLSHCVKQKMEAGIKCLEAIVLPWIKRVAAGRSYI